MKFFSNTLMQMFKKDDTIIFKNLHRWSIDYSHKQINRKIDMANEDNCGPCGSLELKSPIQKKISPDHFIKMNTSPFRISNIDFLIYEELK